jgi:hypothetical protein
MSNFTSVPEIVSVYGFMSVGGTSAVAGPKNTHGIARHANKTPPTHRRAERVTFAISCYQYPGECR